MKQEAIAKALIERLETMDQEMLRLTRLRLGADLLAYEGLQNNNVQLVLDELGFYKFIGSMHERYDAMSKILDCQHLAATATFVDHLSAQNEDVYMVECTCGLKTTVTI